MSYEPTKGATRAAKQSGWGFSLRLSLYFAIIFTIGALGLLGIGYQFIANAFGNREIELLDEQLIEYDSWIASSTNSTMLDRRLKNHVDTSPDEVFLLILEGKETLGTFIPPRCEPLLDRKRLKELPTITRQAGLHLGGESKQHVWAVATRPLSDGRVLQAGKCIQSGKEVLAQFRDTFLIGVLPILLVGVVGGTIMTYKAMRPVRTLVSTIQGILRTGDLSQRADPLQGGHELNVLVDVFNRLLARQQQLIESMHGSLDAVAHDLRTPMARLRATAELALQKPNDHPAAMEALADCLEESDQVLTMLKTMMELSEAEAGASRLQVETLSMADLLANVVELYEFVAEEKQITIVLENVEEDVMLQADRGRMLQLFANLVDNAIKFSPNETTVKLGAIRHGDDIVAWVQDEGPGIRESDQPRIWERLYRADPSRSKRGVGLGLSFVRAITEAHGGRVTVRSEAGGGSRFTVELPINPPNPPVATSSTQRLVA